MSAHGSGLKGLRSYAEYVYNSTSSQSFFALIIIASFVVSLVEAEWQPKENTSANALFSNLEVVFTVAFTLELVLNLFGSWMGPFLSSNWNLFDVVVVSAAIVGLTSHNLPGIGQRPQSAPIHTHTHIHAYIHTSLHIHTCICTYLQPPCHQCVPTKRPI